MSKALWIVVIVLLVLFGISMLIHPKTHAQTTAVTLTWVASGDDGVVGTASSYKMRYSSTRPDTTSTAAMDTWWNAATVVTGLPAPKISGSAETFTFTSTFITGNTYYFVLQACDEVPNCSPYSNVASKFFPDTIPPSRITSLFVQ